MKRRRNPVPSGFIEEHSSSVGEFDLLMWISRDYSTEWCSILSKSSRQHRVMSLRVNLYNNHLVFRFSEGVYFRDGRRWTPCDSTAVFESVIRGTMTQDGQMKFLDESLRRVGMAGYLRAREVIETMLARIGELHS